MIISDLHSVIYRAQTKNNVLQDMFLLISTDFVARETMINAKNIESTFRSDKIFENHFNGLIECRGIENPSYDNYYRL